MGQLTRLLAATLIEFAAHRIVDRRQGGKAICSCMGSFRRTEKGSSTAFSGSVYPQYVTSNREQRYRGPKGIPSVSCAVGEQSCCGKEVGITQRCGIWGKRTRFAFTGLTIVKVRGAPETKQDPELRKGSQTASTSLAGSSSILRSGRTLMASSGAEQTCGVDGENGMNCREESAADCVKFARRDEPMAIRRCAMLWVNDNTIQRGGLSENESKQGAKRALQAG